MDLLNCRLVSQLWDSYASAACRRRHVKLKITWRNDEEQHDRLDTLHATFTNLDNLPWSSCSVELFDVQAYEIINFMKAGHPEHADLHDSRYSCEKLDRFIEFFGIHLENWTLAETTWRPPLR